MNMTENLLFGYIFEKLFNVHSSHCCLFKFFGLPMFSWNGVECVSPADGSFRIHMQICHAFANRLQNCLVFLASVQLHSRHGRAKTIKNMNFMLKMKKFRNFRFVRTSNRCTHASQTSIKFTPNKNSVQEKKWLTKRFWHRPIVASTVSHSD